MDGGCGWVFRRVRTGVVVPHGNVFRVNVLHPESWEEKKLTGSSDICPECKLYVIRT